MNGRKLKSRSTSSIIIIFIICFALFVGGIMLLLKQLGVFGASGTMIEATVSRIDTRRELIFVDYVFKGITHTEVQINEYSSLYQKGSIIKIFVDPVTGAFKGTTNSNIAFWVVSILLMVFGGLGALVFGVRLVTEKKTMIKMESQKENTTVDSLNSFEDKLLKVDSGSVAKKEILNKEKTNYVLKQVKTSPYNFDLYDKDNKVIYTSRKVNYKFLKGVKVEFKNILTNKIESHQFSLYTTLSNSKSSNPSMPFSFTVDKVDVWYFLDNKKIRIEGTVENGSIYLEGDLIAEYNREKSKKINWVGRARRNLNISCYEEYLDIVFLTSFIFTYPPVVNH